MDNTPPWETYSEAACLELFCGDRAALEFMQMIAAWSHVYDDLIDDDKPVEADAIHATMWNLLVVIPTNPFYRQNEALLRPVLATAILNWRAANDMEASGSVEQLRVAHVRRYSLNDLALICMEVCGGHAHAVKNAARAVLMFQHDTWAHYKAEHGHE